MSKITIDRATVEQALEWIEDAVVVLSHTSSAIQGGIGAEAEGVGSCSVKTINALRQALEQPQQPIPQGWKLVPVEMTNAMGLAGQRERKTFGSSLASVYRAMLAAAPEA